MTHPPIQWYPGHIAKAEKQLRKNLGKVDLVIEVRDARIPRATSHPHLEKWVTGKQHLLVINRIDMIPKEAQQTWQKWFLLQGHKPYWCDSKSGKGVKQIFEAAIKKGEKINQRRLTRGMRSRPVRALTLGFPNVGKSALINRLVNKRVVESARRAGVTRSLQWIRIGKDLDLLDAPGVLPPRLDNQQAALLLAICDDIGQAAYEVESIALEFLEMIKDGKKSGCKGLKPEILAKRYGISFVDKPFDPYSWLNQIAKQHASGNRERMSIRILDDFRKGFLGISCLEIP